MRFDFSQEYIPEDNYVKLSPLQDVHTTELEFHS